MLFLQIFFKLLFVMFLFYLLQVRKLEKLHYFVIGEIYFVTFYGYTLLCNYIKVFL